MEDLAGIVDVFHTYIIGKGGVDLGGNHRGHCSMLTFPIPSLLLIDARPERHLNVEFLNFYIARSAQFYLL